MVSLFLTIIGPLAFLFLSQRGMLTIYGIEPTPAARDASRYWLLLAVISSAAASALTFFLTALLSRRETLLGRDFVWPAAAVAVLLVAGSMYSVV